MSEAIATVAPAVESLLIQGDLKALNTEQRLQYYNALCGSLGLNPLSRPFEYITLSGKLTLYARKDATEQLRRIYGVSITDLSAQMQGEIYVVTAKAKDREARTDAATGAVSIKGLGGEAMANAIMKAETKSKRRVTLSLCGLGMLDETETDSIPGAVHGEPTTVTRNVTPAPVEAVTMPEPSDYQRLKAAREKTIVSASELKEYVAKTFDCAVTKMTLPQLNQAIAWLELTEEGGDPLPFPGIPEEAWLEITAAFHDGDKVTSEEAYELIDVAEDAGWQDVAKRIDSKLGVALKDLPGGKPLELLTAALQAFGPKGGRA